VGGVVHNLRRIYRLRYRLLPLRGKLHALRYGDFIMTSSWRMLGPHETANGMLLFGVSTAMIFGVILWLIQTRFTDLKD
jgi:hypothetical protein